MPLPQGTDAIYYRDQRKVACLQCSESATEQPATSPSPKSSTPAFTGVDDTSHSSVEVGVAGASARREHQRRSAKREKRIREAHPRLGGLIVALTGNPQSTQAWARGAVGEEKLAKALGRLADRGVRLLHDRRVPGSRANLDHIVIGPAGAFVIDAKHYKGRPTLRVTGGILRPRVETLMVGRRDCTRLVVGAVKQVQVVKAALETSGHDQVPVTGMLCFVDADWPLLGGSFTTQGVRILWPRKILDHIFAATVLDPAAIADLHACLARAFPIA